MGRVAVTRGAPVVLLVVLAAVFASPARSASPSWAGGTFPLPDGEHVSVYVSTTYPAPQSLAATWATFFGGLPHGKELSLVKVYIAPLDEVRELCDGAEVLGCYRGQEIVSVGDATQRMPPTSIAAHEYGHHVAANRSNAPWPAIDWGPKHWASAAGVCSRVGTGFAFPGDEGINYMLNPGEAFAESYRVLVETGGSAIGYTWPIVDQSFRPDSGALEAVRQDVLRPWTGSSTNTVRGRFARGARFWSRSIATPLDGELRVTINTGDDMTLLASDGRTVAAKSSWTSAGGKALGYRICGTRSLKLRVVRGSSAARFTLRITRP